MVLFHKERTDNQLKHFISFPEIELLSAKADINVIDLRFKYERIHNIYKVFDRFDIEEKRVIHFTDDSKKMYFSSKVSPVRD
jgi:uncharacterized pyridoxamine 5'-phosphate oxidase family protein